jgi:hypothetical protein
MAPLSAGELERQKLDSEREREQRLYEIVESFAKSSAKELILPSKLTGRDRFVAHQFAEAFGLEHVTSHAGRRRALRLYKLSAEEKAKKKQQLELFQRAMIKRRASLELNPPLRGAAIRRGRRSKKNETWPKKETPKESEKDREIPKTSGSDDDDDDVLTQSYVEGVVKELTSEWEKLVRVKVDGAARFVQFNIEHMEAFFASDDAFAGDAGEVSKRVAAVVGELDPDVLAIEEGPSSLARMRLFVGAYLRDGYECLGGFDGGSQRIYLLVKRNGLVSDAAVFGDMDAYLSQPWEFDVAGDCTLTSYKFTRRPLCVRAKLSHRGAAAVRDVYFVIFHFKSKFVARGKSMWTSRDFDQRQEYIRRAVKIRRRIAAECARTRKAVEKCIYDKTQAAPLVILGGDANDGAGSDLFEEFYLLSDAISALLGSPFKANQMLHPVLSERRFVDDDDLWSIEFDDYIDDVPSKRVMLDHIFVSSAIRCCVTNAFVAHATYEKHSSGRARNERPSDHRPVVLDF